MNYKEQEVDFIKRTKKIIEQYEQLVMPKDERYETTLLLNCLLGLLIIPEQKWFNNLPSTIITETEWGIDPNLISLIKNNKGIDEDKSVANIVRHLRNSLAHNRFTTVSGPTIREIEFKDKNNSGPTFEATLSIKSLKKFVEKFTEEMLKLP
jgi:hypothetical protein